MKHANGLAEWPLVAGPFLGLLAVIELVLRSDYADPNLPIALLLGLATTLPLALVRQYVPAAAVTITLATLLTLVASQRPTGAGLVAQLAALYLLGLRHSRRIRHQAWERDASRQAFADSLLEHAARGERARIARELHDVVAHHISMIAVQAETARLTTPGMPPEGASRLVAIGDTARDALTEMRRLLGVLREDAGTETTRRPQPGIQQLNELLDEARELTGASTRLIVHGRFAPLDPGVELTAYRIVQEALTNARRHAPGAAVDVELRYTSDALCLRIRDNGPGPAREPVETGPTGHGLLGMRERAAAVGGELRTKQAWAGGFVIEARLPTSREAAVRVGGAE